MAREGTSAHGVRRRAYVSAGKTGTAQVFSLKRRKILGGKVDERLRDHAWYIAYAPADNPKIALAVLVENGGFGAQAAAPDRARGVRLLPARAEHPAPRRRRGPREPDDESD